MDLTVSYQKGVTYFLDGLCTLQVELPSCGDRGPGHMERLVCQCPFQFAAKKRRWEVRSEVVRKSSIMSKKTNSSKKKQSSAGNGVVVVCTLRTCKRQTTLRVHTGFPLNGGHNEGLHTFCMLPHPGCLFGGGAWAIGGDVEFVYRCCRFEEQKVN